MKGNFIIKRVFLNLLVYFILIYIPIKTFYFTQNVMTLLKLNYKFLIFLTVLHIPNSTYMPKTKCPFSLRYSRYTFIYKYIFVPIPL